jgi:hypothetical protein
MSKHFVTGTKLFADSLNSLDRGGNVFQSASGGLYIDVTGFVYWVHGDGDIQFFSEETHQGVAQSTTNYIYVDDSGALVIDSAFPTEKNYIPLATVVTDSSNIVSINDKRPSMEFQRGPITLPDPGDGQAIPVEGWFSAQMAFILSGSADETNTIAKAERFGQRLLVCVESIGTGSRTITFPAVVNGAHVKCKLNNIRSIAEFVADGNLDWALVFSQDCVISN